MMPFIYPVNSQKSCETWNLTLLIFPLLFFLSLFCQWKSFFIVDFLHFFSTFFLLILFVTNYFVKILNYFLFGLLFTHFNNISSECENATSSLDGWTRNKVCVVSERESEWELLRFFLPFLSSSFCAFRVLSSWSSALCHRSSFFQLTH